MKVKEISSSPGTGSSPSLGRRIGPSHGVSATNDKAAASARLRQSVTNTVLALFGEQDIEELPGEPEALRSLVVKLVNQAVDGEQAAVRTWIATHRDELTEQVLASLRPRLSSLLDFLATNYKVDLNPLDQQRIAEGISATMLNSDPLAPLFKDALVSDILINGPDNVYVDRKGKLEKTTLVFRDEHHLTSVVNRMLRSAGRSNTDGRYVIDALLPDGSRMNVVRPPLAVGGTSVSIRRFIDMPLTDDSLVDNGAVAAEMMTFLDACVKAKLNILVSGGTGTGKTTFLNVLSTHIPPTDRIVTIEDAAELQLQQPHVVRLESRPSELNMPEASARDLVRNALRMRPDRIIIGECRGAEALDMLMAMNTGHAGGLTTIHSDSPRDALTRLESLVAITEFKLTPQAVRQQIARAVRIIVQMSRLKNGARVCMTISELTGMEQEVFSLHDIFACQYSENDNDGLGSLRYVATGIRPYCATAIEKMGFYLPEDFFRRRVLNEQY